MLNTSRTCGDVGETHDAVYRFREELTHAGDAQAAEGVPHKACTAESMARKYVIAGSHEAVYALGSVEGSEGYVWDIQEDHRVCRAGLVYLPQEIEVWHLRV